MFMIYLNLKMFGILKTYFYLTNFAVTLFEIQLCCDEMHCNTKPLGMALILFY